MHVKKNDTVFVLSGDDKGKKGRVLEVLVHEKKAIVEGVNIVSRHTKPNAKQTQGGIIKKEAAIPVSKLALLDPKDGKPTRIGRRKEGDGSVRYSKRSNEVIK
ncbi:MAG: 50S ribosomal protein L24 [Chitinophagales bacterium]|nr:50S ribosomal protein L24 [Bacteroidota bacterium]MBX7139938.1 50S ribosomal protein L24 [Chitinophagales bacterium]